MTCQNRLTLSPGALDNANALCDLLDEDDVLDMADLRISDVCEDDREAMQAAVKPAGDSKEKEGKAEEEKKEKEKVVWEISSEWDVLKTVNPAPHAPAPVEPSAFTSSGRARQLYTLEDVERISSYNTEALQAKLDNEKRQITSKLAAAEKELEEVKKSMTTENERLQVAIKVCISSPSPSCCC